MKIYDENGYVNFRNVLACGQPKIYMVGGRAVGKTYGAIKTAVEDGVFFIYSRRLAKQSELIKNPILSPLTPINDGEGWDLVAKAISKDNFGIYHTDEEGKPFGDPVGMTMSLATVANMRGFSGNRVKLWIHDEFIKLPQEHPIADEGEALDDAYDTINRNRELDGQPPLIRLCLANANDLANPIFIYNDLVEYVVRMKKKHLEYMEIPQKHTAIFLLDESPISKRKAKTVLYDGGSDQYNGMALGNTFQNDKGTVKRHPLQEYNPLVTLGDVTVYQHKSSNALYVVQHRRGNPPKYENTVIDKKRARYNYAFLWRCYLQDEIDFETFTAESKFKNFFED